VQLAPLTTIWLDILQLLVRYGASVHEAMPYKTLTALQYSKENCDPEATVHFFRLLLSESYVDFDVADEQGARCSALWNAVRSREAAASALDTLAHAGVQLGRVYADGRTALHIAAELAYDTEGLKHLYLKHGMTELNRQDKWGWTPLHYAIMSTSYQRRIPRCAKVQWLLANGANPHIQGLKKVRGDYHPSELLNQPVTPLEYAATFRPRIYRRFSNDMRATGMWPMDQKGQEHDVFFDTHEELGRQAAWNASPPHM
jgi:hypothetical protein